MIERASQPTQIKQSRGEYVKLKDMIFGFEVNQTELDFSGKPPKPPEGYIKFNSKNKTIENK